MNKGPTVQRHANVGALTGAPQIGPDEIASEQDGLAEARKIAKEQNAMRVVGAIGAEADRLLGVARQLVSSSAAVVKHGDSHDQGDHAGKASSGVQSGGQHRAIQTGLSQPGVAGQEGDVLSGLMQPATAPEVGFDPADSLYGVTAYPRPTTPDLTADLQFASGLPSSPAEWVDDDEGPSPDWRERVAKKLAGAASGTPDVTPKPTPDEVSETAGVGGTYRRDESSRPAPVDAAEHPNTPGGRQLAKSIAELRAAIAGDPDDQRYGVRGFSDGTFEVTRLPREIAQ